MTGGDSVLPPAWLSLGGVMRREDALADLLRAECTEPDEVIVASSVDRIDGVFATALVLRVARHRARHPDGQVHLRLPTTLATRKLLVELVGGAIDGLILDPSTDARALPERCLLPATAIADRDDAIAAAEYALHAGEAVSSFTAKRELLLFQAIAELGQNALRYAEGAPTSPVLAATISQRGVVEVVASDLGISISEASDPAKLLADVPGVRSGEGALADLLRLGMTRKVSVSIEILSGTGRLRWRWSAHAASKKDYVPGTTVVVRIGS